MDDSKLTVRAVERALDILLCFTERQEWGLTEIAGKVGLHKSTVHRLLASLDGKGFIKRDAETDKYRLGFRIWELSAHLSGTDDPAIVLLPEMERLRDQLGETISLYVRDGRERIRIQAVQSNQSVRRVARVGVRLPLFVGASGKILLAYETEAVLRHVMEGEDWPSSISKDAFLRQLDDIRSQGYATSIEEREPGAAAVAAPIFSQSRKLVAALSVSGPSNRLTAEKMREQAPALIDAAKRLSNMVK